MMPDAEGARRRAEWLRGATGMETTAALNATNGGRRMEKQDNRSTTRDDP